MIPKVSVVVPVYNPGPYLERCVESILGQSLAAGELEAIFVDDGSTDGSGARLDELAARHPHVRVIHQENSGWPGKPRNVGMDAARGEYVFFADADDAIGPEALERLHAMAIRNSADIVLGRIVGHRRFAPREVFAVDRDRATLWDSPLIDALTAHKLFRRPFLDEHGLRFPEGRRRLEDLAFTLPAYFAAGTISILGSYPCYHLYWREDLANISHGHVDPPDYYRYVREIVGLVEAHVEPGPRRDALVQRFVRLEMLDRLKGRLFLESPDAYRGALLAEIRGLLHDHVPDSVDAILAPVHRTRLALARADRLDLLVELAQAEARITARAVLRSSRVTGAGTLVLEVEAGLDQGADAVHLVGDEGRHLLAVPERVAAAVRAEARLVDPGARPSIQVFARRSSDLAEHGAAQLSGPGAVPGAPDLGAPDLGAPDLGAPDLGAVRQVVGVEVDPRAIAAGETLPEGRWDVVARIEAFGYAREAQVRPPAPPTRAAQPRLLVSTPAWHAVAASLPPSGRVAVVVTPGPWRSPLRRLPGRVARRLRRAMRIG